MNNEQIQSQQRIQPWILSGLKYTGLQILFIVAICAIWKEKLGFSLNTIIGMMIGAVGSSLFLAWNTRYDYLESIAQSKNVLLTLKNHCMQNGIKDHVKFGLETKLLTFSGQGDYRCLLVNPATTGKNAINIIKLQY